MDEPFRFKLFGRITNIDQLISINVIRKTLQDIKYAGNIKSSIEVELGTTTLISNHLLNRRLDSGPLYIFCHFRLPGIIMLPILCFFIWLLTKRWHVIMIDWPARVSRDPTAASASTGEADGEGWADKGKLAIARAALGGMIIDLGSAVLDAEGRPVKALGDFDQWCTHDVGTGQRYL
ncbi:hypothetical protein N7G274_000741 [Stereocaulon virgatum]|uniref:Uncharacterized protein n=1 Tax=Stereocaulon virgatum TaxID=373712 RepID=A0ABR4APN9_9LECA